MSEMKERYDKAKKAIARQKEKERLDAYADGRASRDDEIERAVREERQIIYREVKALLTLTDEQPENNGWETAVNAALEIIRARTVDKGKEGV